MIGARESTVVGGVLLAMWGLSVAAAAFESAPAGPAAGSAATAILPEFLDSDRLPELVDAWRRGTVTEDYADPGTIPPAVPPSAASGAAKWQGTVARQRAEELSGRFSAGAVGADPKAAAARTATVGGGRELPSDITEAAMPKVSGGISHVGAALPVPEPGANMTTIEKTTTGATAPEETAPAATAPAATTPDETTTATLPDAATQAQEVHAAAPPADATWLSHGIPPLPKRKSAKLGAGKQGAKDAKAAKSAGKAAEKSADKSADKSGDNDVDETPVKQYRPSVAATPPVARLDPGRKEVFPPYLGAYGWNARHR